MSHLLQKVAQEFDDLKKNLKVSFCPVLSDIRNSTALFEGSHASSTCPSDHSNIKTVNMEHWWSHTDKGKPKYSEKNLSQCHFI
jgi:hypothetical protein